MNNDHSLQFITGTTVDPPAMAVTHPQDDEEYYDDEEYENDGTPWVCKVDWSLPHTGRDIFGCCDGKNISQFSGLKDDLNNYLKHNIKVQLPKRAWNH